MPDSINHPFDLIKLFVFSYPEGNVGGNQLPDGSVCLSPQNPSITNDLPVDIEMSLRQSFP